MQMVVDITEVLTRRKVGRVDPALTTFKMRPSSISLEGSHFENVLADKCTFYIHQGIAQ